MENARRQKAGRFPIHARVRLVVMVCLLAVLAACASTAQPRRYYTLMASMAPTVVEKRLPADVWVREADLAPVINRPQVVYRITPTELQYYATEYWADRPARMITERLESTLRTSGLFRNVATRLGTQPPEYVLESTIHAMEQLDGGDIFYAHLSMNIRLIRFSDESVAWETSFDERRPVDNKDVGLSVRALSEILADQLDLAIRDMEITLTAPPAEVAARRQKLKDSTQATDVDLLSAAKSAATGEAGGVQGGNAGAGAGRPAAGAQAGTGVTGKAAAGRRPTEGGAAVVAPSSEERLEEEAENQARIGGSLVGVDWRRSAQLASDPTRVPAGQGSIFLPALSNSPEREPPVEVYKGDNYISTGLMGRRIPVKPGSYTVYFGSGALSQRLSMDVQVKEDKVTIVQPFWSTLDVNVVSETFIPFRAPYELMDMSSREYFGAGYGADQELGEDTLVWVLRPGLYKIVQPGASYRARKNFATVLLMPSAHIPFTLVLDRATRDFLGAGVSEALDEPQEKEKRWTIQSTLGGDLTWIRSSADSSAQPGTTLGVNLYSDSLLKFKSNAHLWTTRLELEEGSSLEGPEKFSSDWWDESRSVSTADRAYLNSIYMYELRPRVQPYFRVGAESYLQNRYKDVLPDENGLDPAVHIVDVEGQTLCENQGGPEDVNTGSQFCDRIESSKVRLAGPLSPLELKQGAGVNFRLLHNTSIDLDFRLGIGSRQSIQNGRLRYVEESSSPSDLYFTPLDNASAIGPETTILASGRFTRYFQVTTELDALVPFTDGLVNTQFTWRTTSSLRLSSYASLVYVLNLDRNPNIGRLDPLVVDQSLLLRFSLNLL